ncbi:MAG TPA: isoleucine--tRNA ligase [archaeon]|nr:isoleucine--tRNA ligase [archaeon]
MPYDHKLVEEKISKLWAREQKKIERAIHFEKGKPLFSFLEGPPTANAPPALHHLETRVFKDLVCRYKYMKGFTVPRKGGWDCHGLPVEVQVEKKLSLGTKKEVLNYGIGKFNAECRSDVFTFIEAWNKFTEKSGYWIDLKNPYVTLDNDYIESVWWSLKELWKKKLLYEGHKVVPYCPRCETALSSHEVAQGYENVEVQTVTVRLATKENPNIFFLAWTTTPWTLPSNIALAVNPKLDYVFVQKGNEQYILAEGRVDHYFGKEAQMVKKVKGKELLGIEYEPLFDYFVGKLSKPAWKIILADYVSDADGTGIVHTAPAFGEVDYENCKEFGMAFVQPVARDGTFTEEVSDFTGKFVIDADPEIIELLAEEGKLFKTEKLKHDYPFCWRCKKPLLYYALNSWFIAVSKFREKLVKENEKINWFPAYIKEGRFGNWIAEAKDWALSRSKFWGTPLPIWKCSSCREMVCVGSVEELKNLSTQKILGKIDLHKPAIDEIKLKCTNKKCKGEMKRVSEVIDTWYDSGSAPFAQFHYPFENKEVFEKHFPYDFIAEAIDQTRGWFYTLHVLGVLLFGKPAYKNVVCAGHLVDDKGEKMSKSKGNIIKPDEMFDKYGVDATRLIMCTAEPGNFKRVGPQTAADTTVPLVNTLWNTFVFSEEFFEQPKRASKLSIEDQWILSRANSLISEVEKNLEIHEYQNCFAALNSFIVNDFSRWYIKLVRDRTDEPAVSFAIGKVFEIVSKLLAPFAPYISDFLWTEFLGNKNSVHFESWPIADKKMLSEKLEKQMEICQKIVEASNAARQEKAVKLKYVLPAITVSGTKEVADAAKNLEEVLKKAANVKHVKTGASESTITAKPNWAVAGKKFGSDIKKLNEELQKIDAAKLKAELQKKKNAVVSGLKIFAEDIIFTEKSSEETSGKEFAGGKVFLDTNASAELKKEWLVAELMRAVQEMRKELRLKKKDKITLYLPEEKAFRDFAKQISEGTGSRISFGAIAGREGKFEFDEKEFVFGVKI